MGLRNARIKPMERIQKVFPQFREERFYNHDFLKLSLKTRIKTLQWICSASDKLFNKLRDFEQRLNKISKHKMPISTTEKTELHDLENIIKKDYWELFDALDKTFTIYHVDKIKTNDRVGRTPLETWLHMTHTGYWHILRELNKLS